MDAFYKKELEDKISAMSEEIRNYPAPIARCDEQLTGLIEERAKLLQQLKEIQETSDGGVNAA